MKPITRTLWCASFAVVLSSFAIPEALASDVKSFRFARPNFLQSAGPGGARKLRGVMSETGLKAPIQITALSAMLVTDATGCTAPSVSVVSLDFQVDHSSDCIDPNESMVVRFNTTVGPLVVKRAYFANAAGDSIAPAIWTQESLPALPPWAAGTAAVVLAAAGAAAVRRFRRT